MYAERQALVAQLEQARGSRVISYFLSDRESFPAGMPGYSTNIAQEPFLFLRDLLRRLGSPDRIDLFLYTRGGATEAVWPMVTAIRERCTHFSVIVPFRAHSAGTLLCLGADEIVMADGAELSPIDPTTGNQFNPRDPANSSEKYGISVEDVAAYFELSRGIGGITGEDAIARAFTALTAEVHPLALGNVQRVYQLIRRLATRLLALHLTDHSQDQTKAIVEALTSDFHSHVHSIGRREAVELLGDWVRAPSEAEASLIDALFDAYLTDFGIRERFSLPLHMGDNTRTDMHVLGALLETSESSYAYTTDYGVLQMPQFPPGVQVNVPPGQTVPLGPWVTRSFQYGLRRMGWHSNEAGE